MTKKFLAVINLYIIGLTGGIACGKSAIAWRLRKMGATTFDVDEMTRWLSLPGGVLFEIYVQHFGKKIVTADGQLDKKIIGEIIFNNPAEREWINSVAHPILLNRTRDFLVECNSAGTRLVVLEVPLLFEAGWEILCDEVWAVRVKRRTQVGRLMARDKLTAEQALARIKSQMPTDEICSRADVVITNEGKVGKQIKAAMRGRIF
ncbi:MAG: dephospho-CoA kinase [Selenomonadaceae bacterium]|nr:dephospho-CoA kinase [Selenomonadaceae bacterium]